MDADPQAPSQPLGTGPGIPKDRHKHRVETETEVADGDALAEVFLSLGLVAAFRYEKWRTEWTDGEGHCVVDETPIGNYAELEGSSEWIDRAAARLGVDPCQLHHPQLRPPLRPVAHRSTAAPPLKTSPLPPSPPLRR